MLPGVSFAVVIAIRSNVDASFEQKCLLKLLTAHLTGLAGPLNCVSAGVSAS